MSVAHVTSELAYCDSGRHYLFRIVDGVVECCTADTPWAPLAPDGQLPRAVCYRTKRKGEFTPAPRFDMVAANSGRVFAKEACYARFYVAVLEPMFRAASNTPVPSMYFKLDPEQGLHAADNQDRLDHLAVPDVAHPAAVRFPIFRQTLQVDLNDTMIVNVDRNLKVWHRVDGRPPKDGGDPPTDAGFPPTDVVVRYRPRIPFVGDVGKRGYLVRKVLDIGVGHEHWHEQRCSVYGGDMDSLDGPGLPPCLVGRNAYRLFNGPVEDQGGFIDGTVNYYVLAQFIDGEWADGETIPRDAFGILWLDEQAVLSERWRLLDPDDCRFGGFKEVIPSAIVQYLEADFDYHTFRFDRSRFWCPLRAGHVTPRSRMAVSRAIAIVSGRDPQTKHWELYSANFSFGTADRTWRWRRLPCPQTVTAPPEEFGLREDMTLFVKETRPEGVRYWYQQYLPASAEPVPSADSLKLPERETEQPPRNFATPKPANPFDHPWQWLPADVFDFVRSRKSHFGCYEQRVNWRWQYYRVTVLEGEQLLRSQPDENTRWIETTDELFIEQDSIDWERLNRVLNGETDEELSADLIARFVALAAAVPGGMAQAVSSTVAEWLFGIVSSAREAGPIRATLCEIYNELREGLLVRQRHQKGLFHPRFVLALRHRQPLGWIMTHWDKRDDDLLPFQNMTTESSESFEISIAPDDHTTSQGGPRVRLRVESYHTVLDVPQVERAVVALVLGKGSAAATLRFSILPCKEGDELAVNVWRIKLGCLTRDATQTLDGFELLFDEIRLNAHRHSPGGDRWQIYEWDLDPAAGELVERIARCCRGDGPKRFGTSLWFEDAVGHVATPDWTEYTVVNADRDGGFDEPRTMPYPRRNGA